jgi:ABC-type multidrug transport system, ATPase component
MELLKVDHLSKHYPSFDLSDVSFSLDSGKIMGFIGRNGAGKTTTLKCIYNLIAPTSGNVFYCGEKIRDIEAKAKCEIGLLFGEVEYYPNKRLSQMSRITASFYPKWDQNRYLAYLHDFGLNESKKIKELSSGMKVKYGLALALSHGAKVLILDEPTSGLDPVSRDELLDIFLDIVSDGEHAILFSTHVISDLEKCADDITYIQKGKILVSESVSAFEHSYTQYSGDEKDLPFDHPYFIHLRQHAGKFEAVARSDSPIVLPNVASRPATLEEIMIALERGNAE